MSKRIELPLFGAPPDQVEEARGRLRHEHCPRRYCWYWATLSFDWHLKPEEGCRVAKEFIGDARRQLQVEPWRQCCRATGNPQQPDFYEPREPHLSADGWRGDYFSVIGKSARRRRYFRRRTKKSG